MKKTEVDQAERLQSHFKFHQQHYPGEIITPEFATVVIYFLDNNKGVDDEDRVYSARKFLRGIQIYIDALKKECLDRYFDIEMLDILDCAKKNFKKYGLEYVLEIAAIMQRNIDCYLKVRPDAKVDHQTRTVFCYTAQTRPQLIPARAVVVMESIKQRLAPYLKVSSRNKIHFDVENIKYYLWVASEYPTMGFKVASSWAERIAQTTVYRSVAQVFTRKYPFSYLSFLSHTDGTATLTLGAKTKLGAPTLHFLQSIPSSRLVYNDMAIILEFDLSKTDTPAYLQETVKLFLDTLEKVLIPGVKDPALFHDKKWDFIWAASDHCDNFARGFCGLKSLQYNPPVERDEEKSTEVGRKMCEAVSRLDFFTIEDMLRKGLSANHRQWGNSMLEDLVRVPYYSVKLMGGEPGEKQCQELYKLHKEHKIHTRNPFSVIISNIYGVFYLYWCVESRQPGMSPLFIANVRIEGEEDIQFLASIPKQKWGNDGVLRTCEWSDHIHRIQDLVIPYLRTTVERQRKDQIAMILKIAALLMEYGADPSHLRAPESTGSKTIIEKLMDDSKDMTHLDELGKGLVIDMLKLLLNADRKRSHLHVAGDNDKHFLGKFILKVRPALKKAGRLPPQIQSVTALNSFIGQFIEVTNFRHRNVYIHSMPLGEFSEDQQIVDLCKETFPSRHNMSDEDFTAYVKKKLKPGKDIGVIDLVYGDQGEIIAFNIAKIVLPREADRPILHYIPLASSVTMIQTEFRELMSQISFQRTLFLKQQFQKEVLTFYTAASAMSYLQVAKLPEVYPKHDCLRPEDLKYLCEEFFTGRDIVQERGIIYYSSVLFYHAPPKKKDIPEESDINYQGFNTRIEKEGCCPLVGFYATPANLKKLGEKIGSQLGNGITFFSIASQATRMMGSALKLSSSL